MFRDPFPILLSDDLPRLLRFYRDELGFAESFRFPDGPGEPEFVVLALGEAQLGFGRAGTPSLHGRPRASDTGNRVEVCVYVDDGQAVDRAVERLGAAGAPVLAEPADQPWGERAAYVADPDGTPILVVGPLEPAPTPPEPSGGAGLAGAYAIDPVGLVRSPLTDPYTAPKQGDEGAPKAWLEFDGRFRDALRDLLPGTEALVLTWLDRARRDVLAVHPRGDESRPMTGVFSTRSPHRPNPVGLHRVGVLAVDLDADRPRVHVSDLEALDGTPIVDVKPVLGPASER